MQRSKSREPGLKYKILKLYLRYTIILNTIQVYICYNSALFAGIYQISTINNPIAPRFTATQGVRLWLSTHTHTE